MSSINNRVESLLDRVAVTPGGSDSESSALLIKLIEKAQHEYRACHDGVKIYT